ncbi:MAG: heterocyst differentiation related protein [Nostocaceae cyanobacterium]|nr:heterocyst differentiation related protein [Nostocaceae cyanobacterium]
MSESMAFIGGVAIAGLAALVMFKGGGNPLQANVAIPPQMPVQNMQQNPWMQQNPQMQPGLTTATASNCGVESQRLTMERDRLQMENEQLKAQVQNQQFVIDSQNAQLKTNATTPPLPNSTTPGAQTSFLTASSTNTPWWSSGIVWAVGGAALTIGGGIVVAGVFALFSGNSQRDRRTIQVMQPPSDTTYPLVPMRRAEYLPPRADSRRTEQYDYDREYDR